MKKLKFLPFLYALHIILYYRFVVEAVTERIERDPCETPIWKWYEKGRKCYVPVGEKVKWYHATSYCQAIEAKLVQITDRETEEFLLGHLQEDGEYWIAPKVSNESLMVAIIDDWYTNFVTSVPKSGCAYLRTKDAKWGVDETCDNVNRPFMCEKLYVNECLKNNVCQGECVTDGATNTYCNCPLGYVLDSINMGHCLDIDECSMENKCDHVCNNNDGGYNCSCRDGFTLVGEGACIGHDQKGEERDPEVQNRGNVDSGDDEEDEEAGEDHEMLTIVVTLVPVLSLVILSLFMCCLHGSQWYLENRASKEIAKLQAELEQKKEAKVTEEPQTTHVEEIIDSDGRPSTSSDSV